MLPNRYRVENLMKVVRNPKILIYEISEVLKNLNSYYYQRKPVTGVKVIEEDWDNLLILDGCRFDTFVSVNELAGELEKRQSQGSESWEFLSKNFVGDTHHDTVYITSNPHASKVPDGTFHDVINLLDTSWDSELNTVLPEDVSSMARQARIDYPHKRLIIHYMQPHYPFIGELGQKISHGGFGPDNEDNSGSHVWTKLQYGMINENMVRKAYEENLQIVLDKVSNLLPELNGKTVITSDHGNLIGERVSPIPVKAYGHPRGLHVPELVTVPWLIRDAGDRREVFSEPPVESDRISNQVINHRLEALGYK